MPHVATCLVSASTSSRCLAKAESSYASAMLHVFLNDLIMGFNDVKICHLSWFSVFLQLSGSNTQLQSLTSEETFASAP
jgi:hypothetical protein